MSRTLPSKMADQFDVVGIGFGPSNLSLAIHARESGESRTCFFLEKSSKFQWHPGMLMHDTRMQISFLKDLATMRNLNSRYTFLQYLKACGRLERFINLAQFRPTRLEFHDYLSWIARDFIDQVRYGAEVTRVSPASADGEAATEAGQDMPLFRVEARDVISGEPMVYYARNVVFAAGGKPRMLEGSVCTAPGVMHSSAFLERFPGLFTDRERSYVFTVAGGGQSAGEIVAYLLDRYEHAQIHMVISGYAPRPTDNSPFTNEQFFSRNVDLFHRLDRATMAKVSEGLHNANYGVIREDLLDKLYQTAYMDEVKGVQRLFIHPFSRLAQAQASGAAFHVKIQNRLQGDNTELLCDGVVLATGYERSLDSRVFAEVLPHTVTDETGNVEVSRNYRVLTSPELTAGLYVQGYSESRFGLGDTLLSLLPFRAEDIFSDICSHTPEHLVGPKRSTYPPKPFLEGDPDKLYAIMERFSFATLVSAKAADEPVVTQIPLILDRTRGAKGVLFGHMDRANPHTELLDGRPLLVLFHGPNAFISPRVYESDSLPTWNSVTVRVRGKTTVVHDRDDLVRGLCGIAEKAGHGDQLRPDDPRIDELIDLIVGFEIEIEEMVGRFKLSQDKSEPDRRRAAIALARQAHESERSLIQYAVGLPLTDDQPQPCPALNGRAPEHPIGDAL